jgi:hypothetical protein
MTTKRMRKKNGDGLLATADMARKFSERLAPLSLAQVLVDILNGDSLSGLNKERVLRIFQLLQIRSGYLLQLRSEFVRNLVGDHMFSSLISFGSELNELLLRYQVTPQIDPVSTAPAILYLTPETVRSSKSDEAEVTAVMCLLQLAAQSDFDRFRRCECGQFFSAGRLDQHFCSAACRVKAHQSSDEFKSKRRVADRKRYRLIRDGKVKQSNRRKNVPKKTR